MAHSELFGTWVGGRWVVVNNALTTGNVFFVHSVTGTNAAGYGRGPDKPYATLAYALSASGGLTANKHDRIYLMPGHGETVATAAGIETTVMDCEIIGIGSNNNRPTITFNGGGILATVDLNVNHAGITFENILFVNTEDAATAPIDVNAADCRFIRCEFKDDGADNCTQWILCDAAADGLEIIDCVNKGTDTAGNTSFVTLTGQDHVVIKGLRSHGDFSAGNVVATAACTDLLITECHLENANACDVNIELFAACTGWVSKNYCRLATDAQVTWINTPGAVSLFENYGVNADGERGIPIGTASV